MPIYLIFHWGIMVDLARVYFNLFFKLTYILFLVCREWLVYSILAYKLICMFCRYLLSQACHCHKIVTPSAVASSVCWKERLCLKRWIAFFSSYFYSFKYNWLEQFLHRILGIDYISLCVICRYDRASTKTIQTCIEASFVSYGTNEEHYFEWPIGRSLATFCG